MGKKKMNYKQPSRSIGARRPALTPAKKENLRRANARKAEIREERLKQLNPPDQSDQLPSKRKSNLLESHPVVKRPTSISSNEAGASMAPMTASQLFFLQKKKKDANKDLLQESEMDDDEDAKPEIKEESEGETEKAFEDRESMEGEGEGEEEPLSAKTILNDIAAVKIGLPLPIRLGQPKISSVPVQRIPNIPPPRPLSENRHCLLCYHRCNNDHFQQRSTPIVKESPKEADFRVMFVLKKMLQIPNEHLAKYLEQFGGAGGIPARNWITFCQFCQATINKALIVQKKIFKLEETLKRYQTEMTEMIKRTYKLKTMDYAESPEDVLRIANETRSFVVTGRRQVLNPIPPSSSPTPPPPSPPDPLASDTEKMEDDDAAVLEHAVGEEVKPSTLPAVTVMENVDLVAVKKSCYRCPLCPHISLEMNFNLFCSHLLFHYRRPYKCSECNTHYANDSTVEIDRCPITSIPKEADNSGHQCSSSTLTQTKLDPQKLLIWGCDYCDKKFNGYPERDLHERSCSRKESSAPIIQSRNRCNLCQKTFRNIVEWRFHMILEHPDEAKVGCYYCEESFPVKTKEGIDLLDDEALKGHQLLSHHFSKIPCAAQTMVQTEVRICDFCGEPFWRTTSDLSRHMETFHKIPKNKAFSCEICHHRVASGPYLREHSQTNHFLEKKSLICEICGYENTREPYFDHHKFKEHGIVPLSRPLHSCPEEGCDFKTVMSGALKVHKMKEHNAARQHKCETCGKEFLKISHLNRHREIHLNKNLKPFQCEICGNSFAVKNYLYIHMRLSHQNRPFASTHKKKPSGKKNSGKTANTLSMDPEINNTQERGPQEGTTGPSPSNGASPSLPSI